MSDKQNRQRPEADSQLEREIRDGRKFVLATYFPCVLDSTTCSESSFATPMSNGDD